MEKYVYVVSIVLCVFLEVTSTISMPLFLLLLGIIFALATCRIFIFRRYNLLLPFFKGDSESGKAILQCTSLIVYITALSFIAIGSWLCLQ